MNPLINIYLADPLTQQIAAEAMAIANLELVSHQQIAAWLTQSFNAFWANANATPQQLATVIGTSLLPGFQRHATYGAVVLADEVAAGITPNYPWAFFVNGQWITGIPPGWSYTPLLANGQPTGAATVFPTPMVIQPATATALGNLSVQLSTLGAYGTGEDKLNYRWSCAGADFDPTNGTNGSKNIVATVSTPGQYTFTCTISDGILSASTSVTINVTQ